MGLFYRLGMWSDKNVTTFGDHCRKLFYFIYFASLEISIVVGAYTADDDDESVFLTVISVVGVVLTYRMWLLLWRKNGLKLLLNQIGAYSTNDRDEFVRID